MDVRNLKTFLKVSELNNFTKAASVLGYSQSAVTVQMQQLETELGVPLFDRIGKNIKLTQFGVTFIEYANAVIEAIEKAQNFATESEEMRGTIRFGLVDSILKSCFISIFPEFNKRYPHINLSIFEGSAREVEAKVRENELDLCYMLDYKVPRKEWVRVREEVEPIIFVTNPSNPLVNKDRVSFEEITKEKLILMPQGEGYRYLFDDELAKRNLFVTPSIEIANTDTIMRLTRTSNYVTMLPAFEVRKDLNEKTLVKINVPECDFNQWSQLAYLKGKAMTPQLQVFIDTVLELLPPISE